MNRFDILKDTVPFLQPPKEQTVDKTTLLRFGYAFNEESEIRGDCSDVCDITKQLTEKLMKETESMVIDWLDRHGVESNQIEITFKSLQGEECDWILFQRYEVALKTCSNNWEIYHLAKSSHWPRILSSKSKLLIQKSAGKFIQFKNEIESVSHDTAGFARRLLNLPGDEEEIIKEKSRED
jgi:hypothetical protein